MAAQVDGERHPQQGRGDEHRSVQVEHRRLAGVLGEHRCRERIIDTGSRKSRLSHTVLRST
jgi:hypothetical protein